MKDMPEFKFKKERGIGDILNTTFDFIGKNWKSIIRPMLLMLAPLLILQAVIYALYFQEIVAWSQISGTGAMEEVDDIGAIVVPLLLLSLIGFVSLALILSLGYSYMVMYQDEGPEMLADTRYVIRQALSNFWLVLGYSVVLCLILLALYMLSLLFLIIGPFGLIFSFMLVIFFFTRLCLVIVAGLAEREGLSSALVRSWRLTKGKFWFTLGTILLIGLIQLSVSFVFYIPSMLLSLSGEFTNAVESSTAFVILYAVIASLFALVVSILYIIHTTSHVILYFSLVEEQEGEGMMEEISRIGGDEEADSPDQDKPSPGDEDENFRDYFR